VTPEDVLACRREHLPKYPAPRSVLTVDAVPLNTDSKIAKSILGKLVLAQVPSESRTC